MYFCNKIVPIAIIFLAIRNKVAKSEPVMNFFNNYARKIVSSQLSEAQLCFDKTIKVS